MKKKASFGIAAVIVVTLLVIVLWPPPDPLARVDTVAIRPPQWERTDPSVRGPFMDGLTVTLNERNVRIVADASAADAVLVVEEVRVDSIEVRLDSGQLRARLSATCVLTELKTGTRHQMDFRLELRDGTVRATLTARRFWEFWKRG
ncbi:MAG: hypothetical protein BIP78_0827 [Candidatus Bipolaricaulis sibiricus]|uniref:Uncharacterized protein n=1 Tax=Bipolaricaulis sibiricus TaxID=2501609 RepID=A0A410FU94_BIPS1|nr:MAG: hypothetical protein BIP78_0827 [Candidatus Bipolaricaulis sibiricus]